MNVENKQNKNKIMNNKTIKINNKTTKINNKTINSTKDNTDKTKKKIPMINSSEEQFIKNEIYIVNNEGQLGFIIN